jgi:hypothetical protein
MLKSKTQNGPNQDAQSRQCDPALNSYKTGAPPERRTKAKCQMMKRHLLSSQYTGQASGGASHFEPRINPTEIPPGNSRGTCCGGVGAIRQRN